MAKYILTNKAVDDLANIWNYTYSQWSENQADTYYKMLISNCERVAINPTLGVKYADISRELFGLRANRHIIFYRNIDEKTIEITRFLHVSMDLKNRLLE